MFKKNTTLIYAFILFAMLLQCKNDNGTGPGVNTIQINSVSPAALSQGSHALTLTVSGSGFVAGMQVELGDGIEIVSVEIRDAQTILVIINVAANAVPGPRSILMRNGSTTGRLDGVLSVIDNHAPIASFIINPSEGTLQSVYILDATGSSDEGGRITSYQWEISDGTTARGIRPKKEFNKKGTYTVKLTVTDDRGGVSTAQKGVEVGNNKPPVATFFVNPSSGTQLTLFTFDGSASSDPDGTIQTFRWEINGETLFGRIVTMKFAKSGQYDILLKVRDSGGSDSFARKNLRVEFFDRKKEEQEIRKVILEFLHLFDDIEDLSANQIVVGFSTNSACTGRGREIAIIQSEQPTIRNASVEFLGDPVVEQANDHDARASITNRFFGTLTDGTSYNSGRVTHHFTLLKESQGWRICNFFVTEDGNSVAVENLFRHH